MDDNILHESENLDTKFTNIWTTSVSSPDQAQPCANLSNGILCITIPNSTERNTWDDPTLAALNFDSNSSDLQQFSNGHHEYSFSPYHPQIYGESNDQTTLGIQIPSQDALETVAQSVACCQSQQIVNVTAGVEANNIFEEVKSDERDNFVSPNLQNSELHITSIDLQSLVNNLFKDRSGSNPLNHTEAFIAEAFKIKNKDDGVKANGFIEDFKSNDDYKLITQISSPPKLPTIIDLQAVGDSSGLCQFEDFNGRSGPTVDDEVVPVEFIQAVSEPAVSTIHHIPSSLPASQNWPGDYGFDVSFSLQEKNTKGVSWTYSKTKDKLYVGKDAPCPINFTTKCVMPENVKIRAMALYSSPESSAEIVKRCENHSLEEKMKNIFEAEHLVRCESSTATYEIDPSTKRHSVIVPFENPPAGQEFSTYIYKFTCFGSCPFGPNRRPLMLVFSLERGNHVIGRRKVDVKICACPGRDRKTDEQQSLAVENGSSKKRKEPDLISLNETFEFTKNVTIPIHKKAKTFQQCPDDGFRLTVDDPECYEFLKNMKKLYEICKTMKEMPSDAKKTLAHYCKQKGFYPPESNM